MDLRFWEFLLKRYLVEILLMVPEIWPSCWTQLMVGSLYCYLQGFYIPDGCWGFLNHPQYLEGLEIDGCPSDAFLAWWESDLYSRTGISEAQMASYSHFMILFPETLSIFALVFVGCSMLGSMPYYHVWSWQQSSEHMHIPCLGKIKKNL